MPLGIVAGLLLLPLPLAVLLTFQLAEPGAEVVTRMFAVKTVLIAAAEVALVIAARKNGMRALLPAVVAGLVVTAGDAVVTSAGFNAPVAAVLPSVLAYDLVFGVLLALPVIIFLRARAVCSDALDRAGVDASPAALVKAYDAVLNDKTGPWRWSELLEQQLVRRHIRRTLEAVQRGYAKLAVERALSKAEVRGRQTIDDYLLAVPPVSRAVPLPTVATIFVLSKFVPTLLASAGTAFAWFGGGRWSLDGVTQPIVGVVPDAIASLVVEGLALALAFSLVMFLLTPAIRRRDVLLKKHEVCEREVILMDDRLGVQRTSRRLEYFLASFPALPLLLVGGAMLAYAVVGLFVYPSPRGPLGGLVQRADVMHLGPVTGAVFAQVWLVAAAVWLASILKTRRTTRVVFL